MIVGAWKSLAAIFFTYFHTMVWKTKRKGPTSLLEIQSKFEQLNFDRRFCAVLEINTNRKNPGAPGALSGQPKFPKKKSGANFICFPILSLYQKSNFSRPRSLLVMLALAFATVSHAGAFAPLAWRSWETVSHFGRPGRPCLRLSRILGALGGHVCDCLALCASRVAQRG